MQITVNQIRNHLIRLTLFQFDEIHLQMSYNLQVQQMKGTVNLSFIIEITQRKNSRTSDCISADTM